jgi:hypothetical protein
MIAAPTDGIDLIRSTRFPISCSDRKAPVRAENGGGGNRTRVRSRTG